MASTKVSLEINFEILKVGVVKIGGLNAFTSLWGNKNAYISLINICSGKECFNFQGHVYQHPHPTEDWAFLLLHYSLFL